MELNQRITLLENEFKVIKGEIKKLLVDIRESMNNTENPFYNVHNIKNIDDTLPDTPTSDDTDTPDKIPESIQGNSPKNTQPLEKPFDLADMKKQYEQMKQKYEEMKQSGETPEKIKNPKISLENGIDTSLLTKLMEWTDYTLTTIGRSKLDEILDLYALTGNLSEETKQLILKIANLSPEEDIAEENKAKATMKDYITVITQLNDAILNPDESDIKHSIKTPTLIQR